MANEELNDIVDKNTAQIQDLINEKVRLWYDITLFSAYWWFDLALSVLPWVLWLVLRKRESEDRLLYGGLFIMTAAVILDILGDQLGLWYYRYNLIPIVPSYFPWDMTLMPVTVMFLLQIKPAFNPYVKALVFALATSYIGEPIFRWMQVYVMSHWEYYYSVPIQVVLYLTAHYMTRRNRYDPLVA
ncbi:hypothetical protein I8J29_22060 [Paenibacillus sp. MWE-103]|uniref:Uncharacterized protein n=1 Tax=Paenibacillus artemisiicola TaxID=1172618 RepID=A0ABS3WF51_9BACL|nr:CBO0543 family protein [Paenibacillus artemisiicola]MBO7746907.1 hypothetical protein [Paenibacillus artemisiicola]